jgi:hypothetical protein
MARRRRHSELGLARTVLASPLCARLRPPPPPWAWAGPSLAGGALAVRAARRAGPRDKLTSHTEPKSRRRQHKGGTAAAAAAIAPSGETRRLASLRADAARIRLHTPTAGRASSRSAPAACPSPARLFLVGDLAARGRHPYCGLKSDLAAAGPAHGAVTAQRHGRPPSHHGGSSQRSDDGSQEAPGERPPVQPAGCCLAAAAPAQDQTQRPRRVVGQPVSRRHLAAADRRRLARSPARLANESRPAPARLPAGLRRGRGNGRDAPQ